MIEQQTYWTPLLHLQVSQLLASLRHPPILPGQYCRYLREYLEGGDIGLFALFDKGTLTALIHAEPGHPLTPHRGWIVLAAVLPGTPRPLEEQLLARAGSWLAARGATEWVMTTSRNPRSWQRRWGFAHKGSLLGDTIHAPA